jgi:ABC-2 type transport system ATP-binding protein
MRTESAIEVADLRQRYGDFEAVRGVSFDVRRGELFALLGTNGAGKTTTLETLEGYRSAHAGTVRVLGHDPHNERSKVRHDMGVMLQEGGFFSDLNVAETIDLWRDLTPRRRDRAEVLELTGLQDKQKVRVRQLSGGQKRRLDLALAIVGRPEVLFLDEPTTGMDPEARRATWQVIRDLVADGTTVLLTTHYLEEAEQLADRLAIMHHGRIEVAGTVGEVLAGHGDRIGFHVPAQVPVVELPALPLLSPTLSGGGVEAQVAVSRGQTVATYTLTEAAGLQRALGELLSWADERDLTLAGLQVRSASLEDVFLHVVGRTPEEDDR